MIEYKTGDIFAEDVDALVAPVNCEGVMGRGLALQFKREFPDNFRKYSKKCKGEEIRPGNMFVFETSSNGQSALDLETQSGNKFASETRRVADPKYIINFPTKRDWRRKSRMEDIESGLKSLVDEIQGRRIRSIAIPALGCGLGGLEWREVRERMEAKLKPLAEDGVQIVIFAPKEDSETERATLRGDVPNLTAG